MFLWMAKAHLFADAKKVTRQYLAASLTIIFIAEHYCGRNLLSPQGRETRVVSGQRSKPSCFSREVFSIIDTIGDPTIWLLAHLKWGTWNGWGDLDQNGAKGGNTNGKEKRDPGRSHRAVYSSPTKFREKIFLTGRKSI